MKTQKLKELYLTLRLETRIFEERHRKYLLLKPVSYNYEIEHWKSDPIRRPNVQPSSV